MERVMFLGIALALGIFAAPAVAGGRPGPSEDDPGDWPMYNRDPSGSRTNPHELTLGPRNVSKLRVIWRVPTPGAVVGTPAVVGDTIYAGDAQGNVFALDAATGRTRWATHLEGAVLTPSATVLRGRVVVGDQAAGFIFGLDQASGRVLWRIRPNSFGIPAVWGSGTQIGDNVAIGIASNEEFDLDGGDPAMHVFSSRGSVLLLDPKDGRVIWQTFTVSDEEAAAGSSGVSVWTTPTFDPETGRIFVGTGNNFSMPATGNSDALMALDAKTGRIEWVNQRVQNDTWTLFFPTGPDADFGDSPQVYRLRDGTKVVGAGQKNGFYHALDPDTGGVINFRQFLPGSNLGGLFSDTAVSNGVAFCNGNDFTTTPPSSALIAIKGDGSGELWRFKTAGLALSGVAVANEVVYFKPEADPNLYALEATTGAMLAAVKVGASNSGPSIAHGRVFLGLGDIDGEGFQVAGGIVALGVRGGD